MFGCGDVSTMCSLHGCTGWTGLGVIWAAPRPPRHPHPNPLPSRERGLLVLCPSSPPGIPRSHHYVRSRPLTLCEGGAVSAVISYPLCPSDISPTSGGNPDRAGLVME